jgi:TolB protein
VNLFWTGVLGLAAISASGAPSPWPSFDVEPEVVLVGPGVISTPASEIRIAVSPDGRRALWGAIDRTSPKGPGGWDIFESLREGPASPWGPAHAVPFDSPENDFDPAFAPDGRGVYFFSNRKGGLGGDDIYFVAFDPKTGAWGSPENLGPEINSPKDEWAPAVSADGAMLLFASDGRGGRGKHDLFVATRKDGRWGSCRNVTELNTPQEDLDATFLPDGSVVLTSGDLDASVALFFVPYRNGQYGPRQSLGATINLSDASSFGPSVSASEPGVLYFNSRRPEGPGRQDIYRVRYRVGP